jgi:alpha-galactosidase
MWVESAFLMKMRAMRDDAWRGAMRRGGTAGWSVPVGIRALVLIVGLMVAGAGMTQQAYGAAPASAPKLAATPPMGWNDWAHYECGFTAATILENAQGLVRSGLAARGYHTVTIDDCWMQKNRDAKGELQVDPLRFPQGMLPVAQAVHALGLKFGIYEDAGYATCGGFAGSGEPMGGGKDHFLEDARLFASWGVDYLKLDGCNVYVEKGGDKAAAYRKAYAAQAAALRMVGRPIVFSESAPAYFQGEPAWYDVLGWLAAYGQLWREGSDIATYDAKKPDASRFESVLWNYSYNLPLGRFQKPGAWNDADFLIGGDSGMTLRETRSQVALWAMMGAPLILSSEVAKLSPAVLGVLENQAVIAVDQDALGKEATLVRRSDGQDVLLKALSDGEFAVAVLNRGAMPLDVQVTAAELGFAPGAGCRLPARELWSGAQSADAGAGLTAVIAPHDTGIWRVRASPACGKPMRTGAIVTVGTQEYMPISTYSHCLKVSGAVGSCVGDATEAWTIASDGALISGGRCLTDTGVTPVMRVCTAGAEQRWRYSLAGNLTGVDGKCLSVMGAASGSQMVGKEVCGNNLPGQIWALPN